MKCEKCNQEIKINSNDVLKLLTKKWIKLKCSKAEVYPEVLWKNESWNQVKERIPKGCRIPTAEEANEIDYLQIVDTKSGDNDFFIKQLFQRNEKRYPVARLIADSDWADLYCYGDPDYLNDSLGVILVREKKGLGK